MAELLERYDTALIGILQNEGQIAKFLDVIYGFLYRKTDFYMIMKEKTAKMGFPEGTALKLTVGAFKKYEHLAAKSEERRQMQVEAVRIKAMHDKQKEAEKQAETMDCVPSESCELAAGKETSEVAASERKDEEKPTQENIEPSTPVVNDTNATSGPVPEVNSCATGATTPESNRSMPLSKASGDNADDDPDLTMQQKQFQANAESYNGASRDTYSWSQSINDVDVQVKVPKWVRKGSDVNVVISKKHLKACYKDTTGTMVTIVDEGLTWDINKEESMWSLVPGEHIHVNLEKIQERWWEGLLDSEPKISVRKIDPSRPITDLDQEAQAKIEEMMFNEHQKRLGKPQSHERKVHDMLKNAWDIEGSPFKGQPFDPSLVNIQNPGSFNMGGGGAPRPNAP